MSYGNTSGPMVAQENFGDTWTVVTSRDGKIFSRRSFRNQQEANSFADARRRDMGLPTRHD